MIVEYLPESDQDEAAPGGSESCDNEGFQQVMTKKGKRAEKLKVAQAAAMAANVANRAKFNINKTQLKNQSGGQSNMANQKGSQVKAVVRDG